MMITDILVLGIIINLCFLILSFITMMFFISKISEKEFNKLMLSLKTKEPFIKGNPISMFNHLLPFYTVYLYFIDLKILIKTFDGTSESIEKSFIEMDKYRLLKSF